MTAGSRTSDYDFALPTELIAQAPAPRREESRLLVLERRTGAVRHLRFSEIPTLFAPGDALVVNETRVFPARLLGVRESGAPAEVLLLHRDPGEPTRWVALVRPGAKLRAGRRIRVGEELAVEIEGETPTGERHVRLETPLPVDEALERYGRMPLPPYVRRSDDAADRERYQTVYAAESGSVAAPTAGLHFTPELLARIEERGVRLVRLLLHVGVGTFRPVEAEDPAEHRMHAEWFRVGADAAAAVNETRAHGGAVWGVGTTTVRTLESATDESGKVVAGEGWTDLFLRPPAPVRSVDRLVTNFHLPRSTLLMLVAAFAGYERVIAAYRTAVEERYRFYSYGDAMAIV